MKRYLCILAIFLAYVARRHDRQGTPVKDIWIEIKVVAAGILAIFLAIVAERGYSVRRSVATAALVACSVPAMASPLATLSTDSFNTLDSAALAAEAAAMPLSDHFEYGGVIVEKDAKYYYTLPVTSHKKTEFTMRFALPGDVRVAALFHTHTLYSVCDAYFSAPDVLTATRMQLPSYIGVLADGKVRRFIPGKVVATSSCTRNGGSAGDSL